MIPMMLTGVEHKVSAQVGEQVQEVMIPMMPTGVEHRAFCVSREKEKLPMKIPMMPKGVEYNSGMTPDVWGSVVKIPMPPKGVEHEDMDRFTRNTCDEGRSHLSNEALARKLFDRTERLLP